MSASTDVGEPSGYFTQLLIFVRISLAQLVRAPSHSRRAEAARHLARRTLWLAAIGAVAIIALMVVLDAYEIGLMPKRGTASLWPVRILTDFGKSTYLLWLLTAILLLTALVSPRLRATPRSLLISFGTRVLFVFFAVLVPVLASEVLKHVVGRGRPFVGGEA